MFFKLKIMIKTILVEKKLMKKSYNLKIVIYFKK